LSGGSASLTTSTLAVGSHSITATYSGDTNFTGSTSSLLTQTVLASMSSTATALTSSPDPSAFGQQVTLTAMVSPFSGPSGTVQFFDGVNSLGIVALSGGSASLTTAALAVGTHFITASYSGDSNFTGSTSASLTQTVLATTSTTTTLTSSPNPSKSGRPVTFIATVSPSTATGTVLFFDGSTLLGTSPLVGGQASFSTSSLSAGKHSITAAYSGNTNFNGSTSVVLTQSVTGKK
jgi:hypothetical protein